MSFFRKRFALFALLIVVLFQVGCENKEAPDSTQKIGEESLGQTYSPVEEIVDLSDAFISSNIPPFLDEVEKMEMSISKQSGDFYIQSDELISVTNNQKMIIHATWNPQDRVLYVGLKNTETEICYILPSVGGAVSGTIQLGDIPDGEYSVIMYSNDNPSVVAALLYQVV